MLFSCTDVSLLVSVYIRARASDECAHAARTRARRHNMRVYAGTCGGELFLRTMLLHCGLHLHRPELQCAVVAARGYLLRVLHLGMAMQQLKCFPNRTVQISTGGDRTSRLAMCHYLKIEHLTRQLRQFGWGEHSYWTICNGNLLCPASEIYYRACAELVFELGRPTQNLEMKMSTLYDSKQWQSKLAQDCTVIFKFSFKEQLWPMEIGKTFLYNS